MSDTIHTDTLHVIHARAAGLDVHKLQITASVRPARPGLEAETHTRAFSALPGGLGELVRWLLEHRVSAAVMEATAFYWEVVFEALESAGKRRHGHTRKGNPHLRTLLVECAHGAARTHHCQFQGYHKTLTVRRGYKRATVATAHKLLRILYRMLATHTPYRDPHTDYEALLVKRNAPRWIKMLEKYGYPTPDGAATLPDAA